MGRLTGSRERSMAAGTWTHPDTAVGGSSTSCSTVSPGVACPALAAAFWSPSTSVRLSWSSDSWASSRAEGLRISWPSILTWRSRGSRHTTTRPRSESTLVRRLSPKLSRARAAAARMAMSRTVAAYWLRMAVTPRKPARAAAVSLPAGRTAQRRTSACGPEPMPAPISEQQPGPPTATRSFPRH